MILQDYLIHALAGLNEKAGLEDQENLWKNGDAQVRKEVTVARARHPHLRQHGLEKALQDPDPAVRNQALELLRPDEFTETVARCLEVDETKETAFNLVASLEPNEAFTKGLIPFLADPRFSERAARCICKTDCVREALRKLVEGDHVEAAYAMAWCGDPDLRPDLETLLYADDDRYSCAAVLGLEILGATEMIPALRGMLGNDAPPDEVEYPDYGPDGDG